jgi:hypothetical protein
MNLYLYVTICFYGMVLNLLSTGATLPLPFQISSMHLWNLLLCVHRCVMACAVMLVIAGTAVDYSCSGSPPGISKPVIPRLYHFTGPSWRNKNMQTPIWNYSFITVFLPYVFPTLLQVTTSTVHPYIGKLYMVLHKWFTPERKGSFCKYTLYKCWWNKSPKSNQLHEQSPSWEANIHPLTGEMPCLSFILKVHCHTHKSSTITPMLSQMNLVLSFVPHFPKIHLSFHKCLCFFPAGFLIGTL